MRFRASIDLAAFVLADVENRIANAAAREGRVFIMGALREWGKSENPGSNSRICADCRTNMKIDAVLQIALLKLNDVTFMI
jgi:hypothetical protein